MNILDLFEPSGLNPEPLSAPLAERMRPKTLEEYQGQGHLVGQSGAVKRLLSTNKPASLIFWGPPGTGKTTLARILASSWNSVFMEYSAVLSGVAEIRKVVEKARKLLQKGQATVLFIDEIHRFNKAQQDALLPHVESGIITLLGATTENPSFEVIAALLSRTRVLVLNSLEEEDLSRILERALTDSEKGLAGYLPVLSDEAKKHLVKSSFGDARRLLGSLETAVMTAPLGKGGTRVVDLKQAEEALGKRALRYDKSGDEHYNLISALHKSLRGSDPQAALYWLARMLEAGEDPHYLLRRMVRFASEDVGLADPYALNQAVAALKAFDFLGMPEGALALAQTAVYLALAPKSNAVYMAYKQASSDAKEYGPLEVPFAIRNAPTGLMKEMGYGKEYKYPHDHKDAVVDQSYLPEQLLDRRYYQPTDRGRERVLLERIKWLEEQRAKLKKQLKRN
ncbi:replication-associated recombination protein A [Dethiosulfatarculus sandiegensis]|uniref:Replication-associated recombination protein A n=1 Tax=Dethiosulfatarculus sandiegensis TaxID=1429043 RepID=A0A0D2JEN5_9BACT|nr:replication-associated recombination protein A [Dethiosulfatarculus sandiegensis]KIX14101.1 ATPase AAA [Dethiosulfatarculus sandiegensis]